MSTEHLVPSGVPWNLGLPIWTMKNKEEKCYPIYDGTSGDESDEVEPEPPPSAVRRKVSFADAFGLDLVSVKEYDKQDLLVERVGEEFYISCLFTIADWKQGTEMRLQLQKLELERLELLPGSTTVRGIIRVLNLSFHKTVYVRVTLDSWQSHFDLLAEYIPGSSDGRTDCFSFHLVLVPPFPAEGLRVEFCLRYESSVGTFWDNNRGMNYVVFCHQREWSDLKEQEWGKEKESEKVKVEESIHKGIRSCLKTISKKTYTEGTSAGARGEISEQFTPDVGPARNETVGEAGVTSCKSLQDCCKTLVNHRRKRQAARLAQIQAYFAHKKMENQIGSSSINDEITTFLPSLGFNSKTHNGQGSNTISSTIPTYHQIPLVSLDWASSPPHIQVPVSKRETNQEVNNGWEAFLNVSDRVNSHDDKYNQPCAPQKCNTLPSRETVLNPIKIDEQEGAADEKALNIVHSDLNEKLKDPFKPPSSDQGYQQEKEPAVITGPCLSLGVKPESTRDCRTPHYQATGGSLCQYMTEANPRDKAQTAHDTKTRISKAGDEIYPKECSDTSKVKENTHRPVTSTLTFVDIWNVPLTNRQAEVSSSQRMGINIEDSKGTEEGRAFCAALHEEDKESTGEDHSTGVQSVSRERKDVNEDKVNRFKENANRDNSEVQTCEKKLNEGLQKIVKAAKESDAMHSERKQEQADGFQDMAYKSMVEENELQRHVVRDLEYVLQAKGEVTSQEEKSDLRETLRGPCHVDISTASLSNQLNWLGRSIRNSVLFWWQVLYSLGHMTKALVCAILLVIFIYG